MKKLNIKSLIALMLVLKSFQLSAQTYGQDADGFTNIITPTSQLSLDIANNIAIFEFITYSKNNKYLYGGRVSGTSENGVTVLFSEEKIAASSTIDALFGRAFSETIKRRENIRAELFESKSKIDNEKSKIMKAYKKYHDNLETTENRNNPLILKLIEQSKIAMGIPQPTKDLIAIKTRLVKSFEDEIAKLNSERSHADTSADRKDQINKYMTDVEPIYRKITNKIDEIIKISKVSDVETKKYSDYVYKDQYINHLFFVRAGFTGSGFKYDLDNNATTIEDRFVDKNFNGWRAELGYNFNRKRTHFGISVQAAYLNNLSGLDEISYSLTKSDPTVTEGSFSSTQSIKAFFGDLDNFNRYSVNLDFAQLVPLTQSDGQTYLSLNGYMRHRSYSNTENFKTHIVLGAGIYALSTKKNQILGGLFVQTNDATGANSKKDSTFGKRIVFGLVAKFAFKGIEASN